MNGVCACLILGACAWMPQHSPAPQAETSMVTIPSTTPVHVASEPATSNTEPTQENAEPFLALLQIFSDASKTDKAAMLEKMSTAAVLAPTASNRLKLALLKAWPGHPGYNTGVAHQLFQVVLAEPAGLKQSAVHLGRVYLQIISKQQQLQRRNHLLEVKLEEARQKLEALTAIERSVETPASAEPAINNTDTDDKSTDDSTR